MTDIIRNEKGQTFKLWYKLANQECIKIAGLGIDDLPDGNSYDAWLDEATPLDYVLMVLEEEGFPFDALPESHPAYVAPPEPAPRPVVPRKTLGEEWCEPETIILENGTELRIQRKGAANGEHRVL